MKTQNNNTQLLFEIVIDRLKSFYSYEDLNEFNDFNAPSGADIVILLYKRNEWYENSIKMIVQETKNKSLCKTMMEDLKQRIIRLRRLNKKFNYQSASQISKEDKKLMHSQLRFIENYLNEIFFTTLSVKTQSLGKEEKVSLRGKDYPTLEIAQKIILIHYLSKFKLFPLYNSLTTTQDEYALSLAVLFNNGATNIAKQRSKIENKLKEFKKQKKSLDAFSASIYRDVIIVKKWLKVMGLDEIAIKLEDELLG